ncbi:MAG: voltage-gated chloride channel family protein [Acidobacteriaceae bacterium]|nr:voltage-gated chloride channel family protein [Acidobacteriaceae bacterium]
MWELLRWTPVAIAVGIMAGAASALLLWSLTIATDIREAHRWIIWLLAPVGGCVGLLYKHFGKDVEAGNNLIIDEVHDPKRTIKIRMTPFILLGTFLTHLFGGSAGREGTAIQTGASLADQLGRPLGLNAAGRRVLLMAGISAGFGSVFGTPLSGAIFGLEVLAVGAVTYEAIAPCFVAAFVGDLVTHHLLRLVHMGHTPYRVSDVPELGVMSLFWSMVAGAAFGLMAMFFARTTHAISAFAKAKIKRPELRPVAGGLLVSCAVFALGTTRYIGLGVPVIQEAFSRQLHPWDFLAKSLFTSVTLGTGFKGGEVTPLFYIGATMGNSLSHVIPLPVSLLAGMGFVAVFAGAANTPIASALMAMELFGAEAGVFAAIACVGSYLFSGGAGIYHAQGAGIGKRLPAALVAKVARRDEEATK